MIIKDNEIITITLPAIAIKGLVPLPNNDIKLDVGRFDSRMAIKEAINGNYKWQANQAHKKWNGY